jgi:hypothetical protein
MNKHDIIVGGIILSEADIVAGVEQLEGQGFQLADIELALRLNWEFTVYNIGLAEGGHLPYSVARIRGLLKGHPSPQDCVP